MGKRLIINERQLSLIQKHINENVLNVRLKNKINSFLEADYEPTMGVKQMSNEFFNQPLVRKKIDNTEITPKALFDYLVHKFPKVSKSELADSIKGWYFGDYDKELGMRRKS